MLWPLAVPVIVVVWMATVLASGYVGLATVVAALVLPVLAWTTDATAPRLAFALAAALLLACDASRQPGAAACRDRIALRPCAPAAPLAARRLMDERDLLQRLIAGPVSGDALARELGQTRAAVWKRISGLREAGVLVDARPGLRLRTLAADGPAGRDAHPRRRARGAARAAGRGRRRLVASTPPTARSCAAPRAAGWPCRACCWPSARPPAVAAAAAPGPRRWPRTCTCRCRAPSPVVWRGWAD